MAELVFYEKPGCVGNRRQQSLLRSRGVSFEVRDLLSQHWSAETLRAYFGEAPVAEWFNRSAPKVKSGEVKIEALSEGEALELMRRDPLLIRRPLLELGGIKQSGFVPGPVLEALEIFLEATENLQDCPMESTGQTCEDSP